MVLLAAGRGSRLGTLTEDRPKALVQIAGRPLLSWLLDTIGRAGIESLTVVTGYRAEAFHGLGLTTRHNPDWHRTNMVGSLLCARDILREHRTVISYTDILYGPEDLKRIAVFAAPISLAYDPNWRELWRRRFVNPLDDAETFDVDAAGLVTEIGQRPTSFEQVRGQYMGLLGVSPEGWRSIEAVLASIAQETVARLDMTSLLRRCIRDHGIAVRGMPISSPWCEVDAPSDIPIAEAILDDLR